jgi:kynurenine--oxoglutarate transaminase/cysteine-S-conjugate beta-lyase/glutamine--phenylpyruvate transaminase
MVIYAFYFFSATLPGMWERTLTIGSAGKVFAITGVKIGWTIGPEELIRKCAIVHANSIYCCPTFFQEVVARCFERENNHLEHPDCYYKQLPRELLPKRDYLAKFLIDVGLEPVIPQGGYFILADISKLATQFETDEHECKDVKFVKYLVKEKVGIYSFSS